MTTTKKRSGLNSFIATKTSAAPAPLEAPKEKPKPDEPLVGFSFKVPESFRWEFKNYASSLKKTQYEVLMEAIALHREQHGKGNP